MTKPLTDLEIDAFIKDLISFLRKSAKLAEPNITAEPTVRKLKALKAQTKSVRTERDALYALIEGLDEERNTDFYSSKKEILANLHGQNFIMLKVQTQAQTIKNKDGK